MLQVQSPFQQFFDLDGDPLDNGDLYIGVTNQNPETNPISVYWDEAGTTPAAQPIKVSNGYVVRNGTPARVYVLANDYSLTTRDSKGRFVFTVMDVTALSTLQTQLANPASVTQGDAMVAFKQSNAAGIYAGAADLTVHQKLQESVSVCDFGASPSASAAVNKAAFEAALATGAPIRIPAGTYQYSGWSGLTGNNITIIGDGSNKTVLKYTGAGDALVLGTSAGFSQGINLSGITVEGNAAVNRIIYATALARCKWSDVNVREADQVAGIGFVFLACMLNEFDLLMCSQDRQAMTNAPSEGLNIQALAPFGNSSNNLWLNCYMEGAGASVTNTIKFGIRISGGSQNTFIGGSAESVKTYGLLVNVLCQYNTFVGMGFENLNATADVADAGVMTRYINCYASQKVVLQGSLCEIAGGYFERVQIDAGAIKNTIHDIILNHWATGAGGLFDSGTGTETKNVYDEDASAYLTDIFPRFLKFVPATVTNVTGNGNEYQLVFGTAFDDNNNNTVGGNFAAPVKGRYQLNAHVSLSQISTAATKITLKIVTPARTYITEKSINPKVDGSQDSIGLSVVADMGIGDTAVVTVTVIGMAADTCSVIGHGTNVWSTLSGHKVH